MKNKITKTVLFITGAFVSHHCWDDWKTHFEDHGYNTLAPAWPYKEEPASTLRLKQPDRDLATLRLEKLTAHFAKIAGEMEEKPILIGHSMGGLIVQLLLQRGLGCAGIAIHSLQPKGIFTFKFSFYKAGWAALGFFTKAKETYLMSFKEWQYAFTNNMRFEDQKDGYEKLLTPESKLLIRDATTDAAKIDFSAPHKPLLFLAGTADHFIPASLNYTNYSKYSDPDSITEYQLLEGRNHFVLGQETWKMDAENIISWLKKFH
jgi:pimeloyl-ACP methyl ester carboxylesterase